CDMFSFLPKRAVARPAAWFLRVARIWLLFDDALLAIVALGPGVERDRETFDGSLDIDRCGGAVGGFHAIEVLEQQPGHVIGHFLADAVMSDQNVADGGGGHVLGLAAIGLGGD